MTTIENTAVENEIDLQEVVQAKTFDEDLIRKYPHANRKVGIEVGRFSILQRSGETEAGQSMYISPHGIEFQGTRDYPEGTLLKIQVAIPNYWGRKQKVVEYGRIDAPATFPILAKVLKTADVGKRGKKKVVLCETVNMDESDERVLKAFLQEG